uniref:SCP domain-containing protein n=1 Tax=Glossina brevipalpis TaxID=37001 RepID=A0A1A9W1I2_9MUSC
MRDLTSLHVHQTPLVKQDCPTHKEGATYRFYLVRRQVSFPLEPGTTFRVPYSDDYYLKLEMPNCSQAEQPLDDDDYSKMKRQLIIGHNGLRNRIAQFMRVANMMELIWDDDLALMAERHIRRCKPYEDDICTKLNQSLEYHKKHLHSKAKEKDSFCKVSQNRYYQKNVHYPNIIVENALRTWYREKFQMAEPEEAFDANQVKTFGSLKGENNFTHLAYPLTAYFGCSMNKVYDGFLLVCNYHPYERAADVDFEFWNETLFQRHIRMSI